MLSITQPKSVTISSYEFLRDFINHARSEFNESPIRHNDFMAKIKDEIDENLSYEKIVAGNRMIDVAILNKDQRILVGMRESKSVRKAVLKKLHELEEHQSPQLSQDEQLLQLANGVIRLTKERDDAIRTKSQINDRRTATLMNKASQDAKKIKKLQDQLQDQGNYLSIIASGLPQRVDTEFKSNVQTWRVLKQVSDQMGKNIIKVEDPRCGKVNTYHIDVIDKFKEVYL